MGTQACSQGKVLGLWMKILINFSGRFWLGQVWNAEGTIEWAGPGFDSCCTVIRQEAVRTLWPELTFKLGTNGGHVTAIDDAWQASCAVVASSRAVSLNGGVM
jgi:hypothetical protein